MNDVVALDPHYHRVDPGPAPRLRGVPISRRPRRLTWAYIRWARRQVETGAQAAGRATPPTTAFTLTAVADESERARDAVRDAVNFFVRAESGTALIGRSVHVDEVRRHRADLGVGQLALSDTAIDEFAPVGKPEQVSSRFNEMLAAGADSIGLWLFRARQVPKELRRFAVDVLPAIRSDVTCA